jgi:hypothetical protein
MRICSEVVKKRRDLTPETDLEALVASLVLPALSEFEDGPPDDIEIILRRHEDF